MSIYDEGVFIRTAGGGLARVNRGTLLLENSQSLLQSVLVVKVSSESNNRKTFLDS